MVLASLLMSAAAVGVAIVAAVYSRRSANAATRSVAEVVEGGKRDAIRLRQQLDPTYEVAVRPETSGEAWWLEVVLTGPVDVIDELTVSLDEMAPSCERALVWLYPVPGGQPVKTVRAEHLERGKANTWAATSNNTDERRAGGTDTARLVLCSRSGEFEWRHHRTVQIPLPPTVW